MADQPSLFRRPAAAVAASTAAPAAPIAVVAALPEKLDFEGIATMKNGVVYFGEFKQDATGVVTVTVPTAAGDVRTTRRIERSQIASTRELDVPTIRKLAKIGPHRLATTDVERIAPATGADGEPSTAPVEGAPPEAKSTNP